LHVPSLYRHSWRREGVSEVYSAALIVAVTLALSYTAYSLADFHVSSDPVYSVSSYTVYGTPSFLSIRVNSSAPTNAVEFRVDNASSLSGFLALTPGGYSAVGNFCSAGATTFFSVLTQTGMLAVSGSAVSWIDGIETSSAQVQQGRHEVVIAGGSDCTLDLPGGTVVSGPSPSVSTLPMESESSQSCTFLVPYNSAGHVATIVFDGGTQVVDF